MGRVDIDSFGPPSWSVKRNSTRYNQIPPNTNYTVSISNYLQFININSVILIIPNLSQFIEIMY